MNIEEQVMYYDIFYRLFNC